MTLKILGLTLYGVQAASTRYRLGQYSKYLAAEGIEVEISSLLDNDYIKTSFAGHKVSVASVAMNYVRRAGEILKQRRYDLAFVHVELLPFIPGFIESRVLLIPYVYDFDDAWYLRYRLGRYGPLEWILRNKFSSVMRRAAAVTAGNQHLFNVAAMHNDNCHLLPTVVDVNRYRPLFSTKSDLFTIGWIGSPSTSMYLSQIVEPVSRVGREFPVRVVSIGGTCPAIPGVEVINLPWAEHTEVDLINTFDVGVMPLSADAWAEGKCGFKLIQYMACGVPSVASPVGVNSTILADDCGFLARTTEEWADALRRLRNDVELRTAMGIKGRNRVEQRYSLDVMAPRFRDILLSVKRQNP